ncbi:hypothetical protein LCGC14_0888610 [marine sediment metagenome]|uniref:Uncharacterized protein n=1 Tax=marine sediment metagenome TaxID=412755 RepID=A0A0F9S6Y5_9ZZZZ
METVCDKEFQTASAEDSLLVTDRPCLLYHLFMDALAPGLTSIHCYNGNSTRGILKLKILSATYRVRMVKFNCPILFDKGLYIHSTIGGVYFFLVYKLAIR